MRILILNWRCPRHPKAGGAEVLTHEVARRMVADGDQVEWFSASFPGALPEEDIDGVHVVRSGRQWTVHFKAFWKYRGRLRGHFDIVIDEINTMPFFAPLWADVPTLTLIFQLAREVWWYEAIPPLSAVGFAVEPLLLRAYRRRPAVTISNSTRVDLRKLGFSGPITALPVGFESSEDTFEQKADSPTFIFVGRLAPSKRVEDIIRAFAIFRRTRPEGRLVLIGQGDRRYCESLTRLVSRLCLNDSVAFLGHVDHEQKYRHMQRAHALIMASVREGWGLVVTEANAQGTPAVVYDVPGLRDAVRDHETGLVTKQSPAKLAEAMVKLLDDEGLYQRLALGAKEWSREFSFEATTRHLRRAIQMAAS